MTTPGDDGKRALGRGSPSAVVIVDTYNLLHAALGPAGGGRDIGIGGLARLILQSRYRGRRVLLVCDGKPGPDDRASERVAGVEVLYAGPGRDADGVIERLVRDSSAPRGLTVVSSDRRIVRAARRRRAESLASERFLAHLLADGARSGPEPVGSPRDEVPLGSASVEAWMAYFGGRAGLPEAESWAPAPARRPASPAPALVEATPPARRPPETDPVLREAVEHFGGRVVWDELDMTRWLTARTNGRTEKRDE